MHCRTTRGDKHVHAFQAFKTLSLQSVVQAADCMSLTVNTVTWIRHFVCVFTDTTLHFWESQANQEVIARHVRKLFNMRTERELRTAFDGCPTFLLVHICLIIDGFRGTVKRQRNRG